MLVDTPVVTCFLRHRGEVLLLRRSAKVGSYRGRWGAVAGHVEGNDPDGSALREIAEETGLRDGVSLSERGEPFPVEDLELGKRCDCPSLSLRLPESGGAPRLGVHRGGMGCADRDPPARLRAGPVEFVPERGRDAGVAFRRPSARLGLPLASGSRGPAGSRRGFGGRER